MEKQDTASEDSDVGLAGCGCLALVFDAAAGSLLVGGVATLWQNAAVGTFLIILGLALGYVSFVFFGHFEKLFRK